MRCNGLMTIAQGGREAKLTVIVHSIIRRNSRSRVLSSPTDMPPTLAYSALLQNTSHSPLLETVTAAMMNRWHVRDESMKRGTRAQIWSM